MSASAAELHPNGWHCALRGPVAFPIKSPRLWARAQAEVNYQSDKNRRASCSWVALSITALPLHPKQGQWMTSPTAEAVSSVAQQHRGAGDQHIHFRQVGAYA